MTDPLVLVEKFLQVDLDAWTRRVVRRHFDPATGSPYWLRRAAELGFDPRDITRYEELAAFEPFDLGVLRELDPADLVPMAVPRPPAGRVWESGGTTGDPCRVLYTEDMTRHRGAWRCWSLVSEGFRRGSRWVQATPTGPHLIGNGVHELSDLYDARVYAVDADPRWVKRLIRAGRLAEAEEYTQHLLDQIAAILRTQSVDYLSTTPALFAALARRDPALAGSLKGIRASGTHMTSAMYKSFVDLLGGGICGRSYGNTFGSAEGLPVEGDGDLLRYVPSYPQVTMAVVDTTDWTRTVGYGKVGQVRLTVLHDDLFLPNILERDQAVRCDIGPDWPCDGVANVLPLQKVKQATQSFY